MHIMLIARPGHVLVLCVRVHCALENEMNAVYVLIIHDIIDRGTELITYRFFSLCMND